MIRRLTAKRGPLENESAMEAERTILYTTHSIQPDTTGQDVGKIRLLSFVNLETRKKA